MSYFNGHGAQTENEKELPLISPDALTDPSGYCAPKELADAVNVALTLGMPLLLTGEPGSGKSRLAHRIAWELKLGDPLEFVVKSDSKGRDLFYSYDTLGRFHAVQIESKEGKSTDKKHIPQDFIHFNALGRAILEAKEPSFASKTLGVPEKRFKHSGEPKRSVVLIDEIDKAPRDVPNDLLAEIDNLAFRIPELETILGEDLLVELDQDPNFEGDKKQAPRLKTPIVIITSNSEKSLPEAFLRRCIYYHVRFPDFESEDKDQVTVSKIVDARFGDRYRELKREPLLIEAVALFRYLREEVRSLEYKPSMAELLNWLNYLQHLKIERLDQKDSQVVASIKTILLKKKLDQTESQVVDWLAKALQS